MKLSKYRFTIRPRSELMLPPYKGSTFQGGFGHALKRAVCIERRMECAPCSLRHTCIYSYVFETSVPEVKGGKIRNEEVPHPFIIEPPLDERLHFGTGDTLDFHLILIGRAVDYVPYFIFGFEELGRLGIGKNKGTYSLENVISINRECEILMYDGDSHFKDDCYVLDSDSLVREAAQRTYHQITLRFLTPTRIKYNGKLTIHLDFELMMRNLFRRLSWLAEVHCGETWELEWKDILRKAKEGVRTVQTDLRWHDWDRYSERQKTKMKMGGFMGEITFAGDLAEFMPYIILGEYLHIGKGTVYGLGKYEIIG